MGKKIDFVEIITCSVRGYILLSTIPWQSRPSPLSPSESDNFFFFDTESPRHAPRGYSGPAGGADKSSVEMLPRQSGLRGQSAGNYRGHFQQAESGPVC